MVGNGAEGIGTTAGGVNKGEKCQSCSKLGTDSYGLCENALFALGLTATRRGLWALIEVFTMSRQERIRAARDLKKLNRGFV